jgi:serine O-acetyltransferase
MAKPPSVKVHLLATLKADLARYKTDPSFLGIAWLWCVHLGFRAVVLYRMAHWLSERNVRLLPRLLTAMALSRTGAEILPGARIGPGLLIPHSAGVVIGNGSVIGANCTILQSVTLGEKYSRQGGHSYPTLGDDVTICAGAVLLGAVRIGDGVVVGANSVVLIDVPAGAAAVGAPARIVARSGTGHLTPSLVKGN